jgi:cobalt-zinc-cadmium efflux system outer membrane protein
MPRILRCLIACLAIASANLEAQDASSSIVPTRRAPSQATPADTITLLDVLSRVRDAHPLVNAASARVDAARGDRRSAGAFSNPVLQYQVENASIPGGGTVLMDRETMTTAMFPLEPLYQRGPRIARANADVHAAESDARAEGIRLGLEAARSYYRAAIAQVEVDVTRDLSIWLDSVVTYNRVRVKEGIAAEADLIRAQLEEDRAAAELSMQEADLAREKATLSSYLGAAAARPAMLAIIDRPINWRFTEADASPSPSGERVFALAERTPQVLAARERVSSATAGVGVERRMVVRDLSAMLGTKQTAGTTSLIAGVSLPIPLFNQNRGDIDRATAEQRVAEFELAAAQRSASAELQGAIDAAAVLLVRASALAAPQANSASSLPAMLARADESRRIVLAAYREGAVPLLSVLDAARAWGEVRVTFYRALFAQHESALALAAALGIPPDKVLSTPAPVLQVPR